jgi:polyisoprenoid-binding protein YceI
MKKLMIAALALIAAAAGWFLYNKYRVVMPPVDVGRSEIGWVGKSIDDAHRGKIQLDSAVVEEQGGVVRAINVVADMRSISVGDITDPEGNREFVDHITNADFFEVDKYAKARFVSTNVERVADGSYAVTGDLTIKGVTRPVSFTAKPAADGGSLQATLEIDRTAYGIVYGSKGQVGSEKDWFIHDAFTITVNLLYGSGS